jgi:xanthine dehydrogenase accessory factor
VRLCSKFLQQLLVQDGVLVSVHASRGSVPREVGAWMAVFAHSTVGTVGGGQLEWQAIAHARGLLAQARRAEEVGQFPLGPSLGQCCGGVVALRFQPVTRLDVANLQVQLASHGTPVALFGGGHVGQALVHVLGNLPMDITWIDSREEIFGDTPATNVYCEHSDPVQAAVTGLAAGSLVLIMSFSHAEDLDVVAACLERQRNRGDLPFVGLIGSKTKWATFRKRLLQRGFSQEELAHITCPIGISGITDKRPEVIAVAVAAQLLQAVAV